MNLINSIPAPFIFNCWKHHLQFLKNITVLQLEDIKRGLLQIGESQMDLYIGSKSPIEICNEIETQLSHEIKINLLNYLQWLGAEGKNYKIVKLNDESIWTLRFGENPVNFIHIHPGRYSPLTVRVKAHVLKVALLAISLNDHAEINIDKINTLRKEILNLPRVKFFKEDEAVFKMIEMLK